MSKFIAWLSKLVKPVSKIGQSSVYKPVPRLEESEFPLIAGLQQVLFHTDPEDIVTDPVMKRKLLTVYHENMDELVSSVYNKNRYESDHRPYAVSIEMYFRNQLPVRDQLDRLMTALDNNPKPNLRTVHDIETLVHVLTVCNTNN